MPTIINFMPDLERKVSVLVNVHFKEKYLKSAKKIVNYSKCFI